MKTIIELSPIGIIKSPFNNKSNMPIQPSGGVGIHGEIEIYTEFAEGLKDLDGFSHIVLIYHFHQSVGFDLHVTPFMDNKEHGIFSTRAPRRPNAIGMSIVELKKIENNIIHIENVDILNNTPLLDIKPFIPDVDSPQVTRLGWLDGKSNKMKDKLSDNRFNIKSL